MTSLRLRRALLLPMCLALAAMALLCLQTCHAFSSYPPTQCRRDVRTNYIGLYGKATNEEEDRSRPDIFVIKSHDDYVKFLEEDDRLVVLK